MAMLSGSHTPPHTCINSAFTLWCFVSLLTGDRLRANTVMVEWMEVQPAKNREFKSSSQSGTTETRSAGYIKRTLGLLFCQNNRPFNYIYIFCWFYSYLDVSSDTFPYMYIVVCNCLVCGKRVTAQETGSELHCTWSQSQTRLNMVGNAII